MVVGVFVGEALTIYFFFIDSQVLFLHCGDHDNAFLPSPPYIAPAFAFRRIETESRVRVDGGFIFFARAFIGLILKLCYIHIRAGTRSARGQQSRLLYI